MLREILGVRKLSCETTDSETSPKLACSFNKKTANAQLIKNVSKSINSIYKTIERRNSNLLLSKKILLNSKNLEEETMIPYFESLLELDDTKVTSILTSIQESGDFEDSVLVLANLYLKKAVFNLNNPKKQSILKMYLVCILLAHKYLIDYEYWELSQFAELIRVSKQNLEKMEVFILKELLDFDLFVEPERIHRISQAYLH